MPTDSARIENSSPSAERSGEPAGLLTRSCDAWCDLNVKRTLVATALLAVLATACTSTDDGPSATDAATDLAKALTAGHLADQRFRGGTPQQAQSFWSRTVTGMGDARPRVTVGRVSEHDDGTATARLTYAWTLPGGASPWRYATTARLSQGAAKAWRVRLTPTLVQPALRVGERLVVHRPLAERADILGAGRRPLVTARPVLRFGIDKAQVAPGRQA